LALQVSAARRDAAREPLICLVLMAENAAQPLKLLRAALAWTFTALATDGLTAT